jgi:heat shock factor-binding protein 1
VTISSTNSVGSKIEKPWEKKGGGDTKVFKSRENGFVVAVLLIACFERIDRESRENKIKMSGSATAAPSNMSNLDTPEDLDQFVQELMDNMVRRTENGNNYYYFVVGACSDLDCHSSTNNSRFPTSITTCTLYEQQTRFNRLSDSIIERVDTMGNKIDQLEKSINELIDEAGIETPNSVARKDSSAANHKIMEGQDESDTAEF